ncbi:Geranylgeranyl pyrophosphate synthase [Venturia nashicola]|nr:Geranylgeranyl pyrophosphate synthase [Venturia nashicola]
MLKALNHRIDRISKQKVQPSNNREFPHSPQQLRLDSFKSQNCAARDMPPIIFHFTGQEQLQSPGFHPIISQNHIAPKSIRSENPQINFLTLPREIRQTILLMAVEGSMIRCYTLSKISRRWAISGFWDDLNYAAYKMIGSLKMLEEQDIVGDMEWVVRRSSDTLSVRRGQWVVRRDMTGNLNRCLLSHTISKMPPATFLTLPRELRQKILLSAVKSSIVREWRVEATGFLLRGRGGRLVRSFLRWGYWNDDSTAACNLLDTLRELGESGINMDLNWVKRTLAAIRGTKSGNWKLKKSKNCRIHEDGNFQQPSTTSIKMKINRSQEAAKPKQSKVKVSHKPRTNFMSLPREIRQTILLIALLQNGKPIEDCHYMHEAPNRTPGSYNRNDHCEADGTEIKKAYRTLCAWNEIKRDANTATELVEDLEWAEKKWEEEYEEEEVQIAFFSLKYGIPSRPGEPYRQITNRKSKGGICMPFERVQLFWASSMEGAEIEGLVVGSSRLQIYWLPGYNRI